MWPRKKVKIEITHWGQDAYQMKRNFMLNHNEKGYIGQKCNFDPPKGERGAKKGKKLAKSVKQCQKNFADILRPVIHLETCSKVIFRIASCISNKMGGQPFLGDKFSRFSSYFSKRGIFPKKCRKSANQLSKKCWRRRKNDVIGKILTSFQSLMIVPISCPVDTHQTSFCGF